MLETLRLGGFRPFGSKNGSSSSRAPAHGTQHQRIAPREPNLTDILIELKDRSDRHATELRQLEATFSSLRHNCSQVSWFKTWMS